MDFWPPHPETQDCLVARAAADRYVTETLSVPETQHMRKHLAQCSPCREHYEEAVRAAATIGRASRVRREQEDLRRFRRQRRHMLFDPVGKRARWFRLRTLLYPAFVIFLLAWVGNFRAPSRPRPGFLLGYGAGEVEAKGQLFHATPVEDVLLSRGAYCATRGEGAHSTLQFEHSKLEIFANSALHVVGVNPPSVRFHTGRMQVEGPLEIVLAVGVVKLTEGRAEIKGANGRFTVACLAGSLKITDAAGEQGLATGALLQLPRP